MKVPTYRTFKTSIDHIKEDANIEKYKDEAAKARRLLRQMVASPDYERFKSINKKAAKGDVRFNFMFLEDSDKIHLSIADRKVPTFEDAVNTIKNLFKIRGTETPLPTMTDKECRTTLKSMFRLIGTPAKYPVKRIAIDPSQPYAEKVNDAVRELVNARLFGSELK